LAPSRFEATQVYREDNKFVAMDLPVGYRVEWDGYREHAPGCWLAEKMTYTTFAVLALPKEGKDFKPVMTNGKPALYPSGERIIDFTQTTKTEYAVGVSNFAFSQLQVNQLGRERLCGDQYPIGTVVENRISKETYQLEGVSAAIDTKLKKMLSDPTKLPVDEKNPAVTVSTGYRSSTRTIVLLANGVALMLIALGYLWSRRRRAVAANASGGSSTSEPPTPEAPPGTSTPPAAPMA
jgi:hypothetical protein